MPSSTAHVSIRTITGETASDEQRKVAAELKASYDEDLGEPSISPRQAADRVLRKE